MDDIGAAANDRQRIPACLTSWRHFCSGIADGGDLFPMFDPALKIERFVAIDLPGGLTGKGKPQIGMPTIPRKSSAPRRW